jgi:hypothetical protein
MNKIIRLGLLSILTTSLLCLPGKSEAAVSLFVKARAVKVVGAVATIGGATGISAAIISSAATATFVITSFITFGLGMIILDEDSNYLAFNAIDLNDAGILGVSQQEIQIYNSEIAEINSIREEVEALTTLESTQDEVIENWLAYSSYISPESFKVMQAIAVKTVH